MIAVISRRDRRSSVFAVISGVPELDAVLHFRLVLSQTESRLIATTFRTGFIGAVFQDGENSLTVFIGIC